MATRKASNSLSKKKPDLPTSADEIVPFSHSAAGHEGISTYASGEWLIKPCTQAEIDFYQSAAGDPQHAYFYEYMPNFHGEIRLAANQELLAPLLNRQDGIAPMTALQQLEPRPSTPPAPNTGLLARHPTTTSLSVKRSSGNWKPSGGKKLQTGLAIAIENATAGVQCPCILDVKLGARLWDDDAPAAKRQKLDDVARDSTSRSLGFRIAGMKVWLGNDKSAQTENLARMPEISRDEKHLTLDKDGYVGYDKFYGRTFNKDNVKDAFTTYLGGLDKEGKLVQKHAKMLRDRLIRNLESIEFVLENEESRMYSASILMVYEGNDASIAAAVQYEDEEKAKKGRANLEGNEDEEAEDEDEDEGADSEDSDEAPPRVCDTKLIDFAHARWTPGEGPDENALQGVRSVIKILKEIQ